ncbi:MAG TPA: ankyrin repeat domain-containing protein [Elusimicrobiota bacterium]|nr:ankyrin repeat domain-containing protein [Elusimicrobiota bacterium]
MSRKIFPFLACLPLLCSCLAQSPALGPGAASASAQGLTPLMAAAQAGDANQVAALLAGGAKVDAANAEGSTALVFAAQAGSLPAVKLLLAAGAPGAGPAAYKALMLSAAYGRQDVESYLLAQGFPAAGPMTEAVVALARREGYLEASSMLAQAVAGSAGGPPAAAPDLSSVSSDVDEPSYHEPVNEDSFAVVVGVEDYARGLPPATFARRDALAVQRHLEALGVPPDHIRMLLGQDATQAQLAAYLERWLPRNADAKSAVFFYFSGHGAADPAGKTAYLVPFDGDPEFLDKTGFPLSRLYRDLQKLGAARALVLLDSCFSGAGERSVSDRGERPLVTEVDWGGPAAGGSVAALTAASGTQTAGVLADQGHGAFTYYLLKGLNGAAKDAQGSVTLSDLYAYLKGRVEKAAALDNRAQTPQLLPEPPGALGGWALRKKGGS